MNQSEVDPKNCKLKLERETQINHST